MYYSKFLEKGDIVGITAPSDGIIKEEKIRRLENAEKKLLNNGYKTIETDNVRKSINVRSSSPKERAKQLEDLFKNKDIKAIICASGGEFLLEMLPYLDYNIVRDNPKWIQGFSDPTGLLYTITTKLDIATIYSNNFTSFGMEQWHESVGNNLKILEGNIIEQNSFDMYENEYTKYETGLETYKLTDKVEWKNLRGEQKIEFEGRVIGGCLDVLLSIIGTRYDYTKDFIERYKEDGIVWFFDNCELTVEDVIRGMWQIRESGYFKNCKGIIFGRNGSENSYNNIKFSDAIIEFFKETNIPIIIDADIGHKPPQITIINGSYGKFVSKDGKGKVKFYLK